MQTEDKSRETKNKILKAAMDCFSSKDYELTGVDEICEKAGITKGGFYYHFNTKQDLLLELLNQWMEKIANILESAKKDSGDFASMLVSIPHKIKPHFEKDIKQISIFLQFYVKGISDPSMSGLVKSSYKSYLDFFSGIIQQGIDAGIMRKYNPVKISRILFALTIGLLMQGLIDPDGEDWESFARECIMFFI